MTPKRKSSRSSNAGVTIGVLGLLALLCLCLGGLYLLTGRDPAGVFSDTSLPPTSAQPSITRPAPSQPTEQARGLPTAEAKPANENWWQVFFTDPTRINNPDNLSGSIPEKLIGYINQAQRSIHIAAFEFDLTPVAEALIAAQKRGVDVRWVTDDEHGLGADQEEGHGQFKLLKKAGIDVRADDRSALMHNKFIIFDGQTVWTGSTNLTVNDNFRNNNNVIVIDSQQLAEIYETQFNDLWNGYFDSESPSTVDEQALTIRSTQVQVLFSPEDDAMPYLIALVESAEKSIRFMAFSYTEDALTEAMLERAKAGVDVSGIFETRGSETEYSALPPLYCAGLAVRQDGNKGTFHHKVILVDGKIVVTGSLNFSDNANNSNNENTLILMNSRIAQQYAKEFERRWAEAVAPDAGDMNCP